MSDLNGSLANLQSDITTFGFKPMIWWGITVVLTLIMLICFICVVIWKTVWFKFEIGKIRKKVKDDKQKKSGFMFYPDY